MEKRMDYPEPFSEKGQRGRSEGEHLPLPSSQYGPLRTLQRTVHLRRKTALLGGLIFLLLLSASLGVGIFRASTAPGHQKWAFHAQGAISAPPTVVNGMVYVGTDPIYPDPPDGFRRGILSALDATSGNTKWSFPTSGKILASPIVSDGMVYVNTGVSSLSSLGLDIGSVSAGMLYALDALSGRERWSFPIGGANASSPTVMNGTVYAISRNGTLAALDAASGNLKWSFSTNGNVSFSPLVVNSVVYVASNKAPLGSDQGTLSALDAISGRQKWSFETHGGLDYPPTVTDGMVYLSSFQNLYALGATSGREQWADPLEEILSPPTVVNGMIYLENVSFSDPANPSTETDTLYALDAASGIVRWSAEATASGHPEVSATWSPLIVVNGVLYITSEAISLETQVDDNHIYAFGAISGSQKWSHPLGDENLYALTVVNNAVYISSLNGGVFAFDVVSGNATWFYATRAGAQFSPTVVHGIVYVGTTDGTLYALQAQ